MAVSTKELTERVSWYQKNSKVGQTIRFTETLNIYGKEKVKEYKGIFLELLEDKRSLKFSMGLYDEENKAIVKKEFNTKDISDMHKSRLPKELSTAIKSRYLDEKTTKVTDAKYLLNSLANLAIYPTNFKENAFLYLLMELDTVEDGADCKNTLYALKSQKDLAKLTKKYPNFNENFVMVTANHFKAFVNNNTLSIQPYVLCKKTLTRQVTYYQALEVTLNRKVSTSERDAISQLLKDLSNI